MFDVQTLLAPFTLSFWGLNGIDFIILFVVAFYAYEGYSLGFVLASVDLVSFILSFICALLWYPAVSTFFMLFFSLPIGVSHALSFFIIAFVLEVLFSFLLRRVLRFFPTLPPLSGFAIFFKKIDHWAGIVPGLLSAFIVLSFLLTVIVSLPSSPFIKQMITGSRVGEKLVANTSFFEDKLNDIFGGALQETLNFLTVEPQSNETVQLKFIYKNGTVDSSSEQEMFQSINTERIKAGLDPFVWDESLADVARAHSQDMLVRGYFSHYTPEGLSPFDRLGKAELAYSYAGENLALAPTVSLAMQGLMNSPGHRANMLNVHFTKVGVGVIDGGIYGKMFSQEFTD